MDDPARLLLREFLDWLAAAPRCYGDVMEAWRTSCPRMPIWEEATERGLVTLRHDRGLAMANTVVALTRDGERFRDACHGMSVPG